VNKVSRTAIVVYVVGLLIGFLGGCSNDEQTNDDSVYSDSDVSDSGSGQTHSPPGGPPASVVDKNVREYVKSRLVNPASANMGAISCVSSKKSFANENGSWEAKFTISASNSFGATVQRDRYVFVDDSGSLISEDGLGVLHSFGERDIEASARIEK
jgi:hypothetical protein